MIDRRNDTRWTVYAHVIPKSLTGKDHDKYYVGMTGKEPNQRFGKGGCHYYSKTFSNAIKKYGWDNIKHEIIASNLTYDEASDFEKALIAALKSNIFQYGYNRTAGNNSVDPEIISRISKRVFQFTLDGNFVARYKSIASASRNTGIGEGYISNIAYSKTKVTGLTKYIWRFEDEVELVYGVYKMKNTDAIIEWKVYQFDADGKFISSYTSTKQASEKTGISYDIIHGQLRAHSTKRLSKNHSYIWRRDADVEYVDGTYKIKQSGDDSYILGIDVYQFDSSQKYIGMYKNGALAANATGVSQSAILRQVKRKPKVIFTPYYWRGKDDVQELPDGSFLMLN